MVITSQSSEPHDVSFLLSWFLSVKIDVNGDRCSVPAMVSRTHDIVLSVSLTCLLPGILCVTFFLSIVVVLFSVSFVTVRQGVCFFFLLLLGPVWFVLFLHGDCSLPASFFFSQRCVFCCFVFLVAFRARFCHCWCWG